MKKGLSLLLALVLLLSLAPIPAAAAADGTYRPDAAIAYAETHWNADSTDVCDQFVKGCLSAGGVTIRAGGVDEVKNALVDAGFGTLGQLTVAENGRSLNKADNPKLKKGDPIFYYCPTCGKSVHTVIIAGFDDSGNAYCYGRNPSWEKVDWFGTFRHQLEDDSFHGDFSFTAVHMDTSPKTHAHSFQQDLYEKDHPHRMYDECGCGARYYLGWNARVSGCTVCNPPAADVPLVTVSLSHNGTKNVVKLTWTTVAGAASYSIHRQLEGNPWFQISSGLTSTTMTNTSVEPGKTYSFKVEAVTADGAKFSDVYTVTMPAADETPEHTHVYHNQTVPASGGQPGHTIYTCACGETYTVYDAQKPVLTATVVHNGTKNVVKLSWTSIPGATSHNIHRCREGNTTWHQISTGLTASSVTNSSVEAGVSYRYKVEAVTASGSVMSDEVTVTVPAGDHTHSYTASVTAPTCTKGGYTTYTCSCGHSYTGDAVAALGHSWDEGVVTTQPAYTAPGVKTFTCALCGGTRTEEIPQLQSTATFTQASVSLAGDIGLNFYVKLSENLAKDPNAFIRFTFDDQVQEVPMSAGIRQKDGTYRYSCKLAAKDMACAVTAQVYTKSGPVGESQTYSVRDYCLKAIPAYGAAGQTKLVTLLKAMLNYGAQSQISLKHQVSALANAGLSAADQALAEPGDLTPYAYSVTGAEEGIALYSASLSLKDTTTIRVYFQLTGSKTIDQFTFTGDGKILEPVHYSGKYYYVDLVGIAARNLDTMYHFTCGGLALDYCGLSYVVSVMGSPSSTQDAINMAKALYGYAVAAIAYLGK